MIVVSNITKMATLRFTRLSRNSVVMSHGDNMLVLKSVRLKNGKNRKVPLQKLGGSI